MKTRKDVRVVTAALTGVVMLAGGGWVAAGQIKSPAQIAADTAPPKASLVTAQVQRGSLSTEVIVRGTGRYGEPQLISLPSSSLKTSTQLVSQIAKRDDVLHERSIAMTVSGRPVFVLQGATPMHRDIGPGDSGQDVRQLEQALVRFGYGPGRVDGNYDSKTAAAVARMYRAGGAAPFGLTEAQIDKLNTAAALVATTNDYMIQQRLALRTAQRGATPAEVNQARIDAAAVAELIPPARSAISAARARIAEAQDLEAIARRQQAEGDGTLRRDVAAAQVDIATKQGAVDDAVTAQFEAQRAVDALPPDATPAEVEAARSNLRIAAAKLPSANAELSAARAVVAAAENALRQSSVKARDDGRKAARDLALARSDLREGKRTVRVLTHKRRIAVSRVQILATPLSSGVERQAVSAATSEVNRAKADLARLASRSGVQVPADEILFFPNTPVRVDSVTAKPGTQVAGDLMTVSNTTLAIDSGLSPQDAKLVKTGQRVHIEDSETGIDLQGHVTLIADRPGTNLQLADPTKTAFEVTPVGGNKRLVDTSVRLTIAIKSTKGKVLTVPYSAVSVRADGRARVQVDIGGGRTRLVIVNTGLAAEGNVEVSSARRGALREGDRVIIGEGSSFAATKAPTGSEAPATPAAVSPSSSSGSGSGSGAGATPGTTAPGTTAPAGGTATAPATGGPAGTAGAQGGTRGP
ncbi:MAG TPA: peptidoglycan-binding domain-containing protein [Baekduia sp.]|nr:peptidoglycan-binding domain-containing protein [Baekduia sp.]